MSDLDRIKQSMIHVCNLNSIKTQVWVEIVEGVGSAFDPEPGETHISYFTNDCVAFNYDISQLAADCTVVISRVGKDRANAPSCEMKKTVHDKTAAKTKEDIKY